MIVIRKIVFYEYSRWFIRISREGSFLFPKLLTLYELFQILQALVSIHFDSEYKQIVFMVAAASRFVSIINFRFLFQYEISRRNQQSDSVL